MWASQRPPGGAEKSCRKSPSRRISKDSTAVSVLLYPQRRDIPGGRVTIARDAELASNLERTRCSTNAVLHVGDGVIVADTDNHTIRKVLFSGGTITLAGLAHNQGSEDGAAADARSGDDHRGPGGPGRIHPR
jgi:hypothetical protein